MLMYKASSMYLWGKANICEGQGQ